MIKLSQYTKSTFLNCHSFDLTILLLQLILSQFSNESVKYEKISELYVSISMGLYKITLHLYGIWALRFDLLN